MTTKPSGWRKSSYSGNQTNCVEVGRLGDTTAVRDTKNRDAGWISATPAQWADFLAALK